MKNKILAGLLLLLMGTGVGFKLMQNKYPVFNNLSREEMLQHITEERSLAIRKAKNEGEYKCCIEPPCTMCFMEANKWNNFTPGTCACDDLIAEGKEPCPQCKRELCSTSAGESKKEKDSCEVNLD